MIIILYHHAVLQLRMETVTTVFLLTDLLNFPVFSWNTSAKIGHGVTKPRFLNTSMYFWPLSVSGDVKGATTNAKSHSRGVYSRGKELQYRSFANNEMWEIKNIYTENMFFKEQLIRPG